jgi:hypothetical protein
VELNEVDFDELLDELPEEDLLPLPLPPIPEIISARSAKMRKYLCMI